MSASFVWVRPATEANRVKVKTEKIGEVELPVYVQASGDGTLISETNALPVTTVEHLTTYTEEYTADGSGNIASHVAVAAPSGAHLGVEICTVSSTAAAGTVNVDFATSGIIVFRLYCSKTSSSSSAGTHVEGTTDEGITISGTGLGAGSKVFISMSYVTHNA